ncbi:TIGR04255 family protein [Chryseotalea sanaruensis]|uniref:TIGR04255 family protein n=1 Tax=Chryseotalea sanaruensis TaxID=2482724 RepID=A0A401UC37_9BACT|nr:TIGR04255 family protein [Chryseotalea sanaruensis]GCC52434.1 TIGR04255 family protein [Chryseotalea sanaruensis]
MAVTKKYKNPPLTEAVFEIFFTCKDWSPIVPGIFYNEIKSDFPNISQASGGAFGISFDASGFQIGPGSNDLTQYKSPDNSTIIQLSNGLFTVNKLPRYEGWENYRKVILSAVTSLEKSVKIERINRIGLKTINKIDLNKHTYENFRKSYNVFPSIPQGVLSNDLSSIQLNIETPAVPETEILALSLVTLKKEPKYEAPSMLQLYYTRIKDNEGLEIKEWLEVAHSALHKAFDTIITEQKKKEFDV